jgi:hypothetical protein
MMKAIRFIIVAAHLVFLVILLVSPDFSVGKKKHKPLLVKTVVPKIAAVTKTSAPASAPAPKKAAPKKAEPVQRQTPKKDEKVQKPAPKKEQPVQKQTPKKEPAIADKQLSKARQSAPAAPAKKSPPPQSRAKISDSLRKELEESIASIEAPVKKKTPSSSKVLAPIALQVDAISSDVSHDESYTALLISQLHQVLSLPDYGEVKIQLSLRQDGSVAKITVLKAQSGKNKQYLEAELPRIKFPRLDGMYGNKKECTFILTFCNE